jgi:hypothetical protein
MDEQEARAIFARMSGAGVPPSRVSVEAARTSGRRKLRRRRAALSGTPAVAVAVVALLAGGILPGFHAREPHQSTPPAAGSPPPPTRAFDPLVPYATLGWLPDGGKVLDGTTDRHFQFLDAGTTSAADWLLSVFSEGRCNLTAEQILQRLRQGMKPSLKCTVGPGSAQILTVKAQAPSVHGRLAFSTGHGLVWEYTRGSWATLQDSERRPSLTRIVRVAAGVTFGRPQPALEYPFQLTGLPAAWQISGVHFEPDQGIMRGRSISLGPPRDFEGVTFDATLATPRSYCSFFPGGQSQRRTINGIAVIVTRTPGRRHVPVTYQVCAAHARGLDVLLSTYGPQRPRAVSIFTHNLRILGSDPARWTTRPLG